MIKYIKKIIHSSKDAWYSGRGFSAHDRKQYERALHFYNLALKYSDSDSNPIVYESMAFAHYRLKQYEEALNAAYKSLEQYNSADMVNPDFASGIKRTHQLIQYLENK